MPEAKPRDTNMPNGIISISQFKINTVSARGIGEGLLKYIFIIMLMLQIYTIID